MSLFITGRVSRLFAGVILFALLLASPWAMAAPVGSGVGVVKDTSGAVVAKAKLTLRRLSTNAVLTTTSDASGSFQFLELVPDVYTLTAEAAGFKRVVLSDVTILVDQATRIDITLSVGDVSEVVDVAASAPLIETQQNTISNVVDHQAISTMPLNSRNFLDLALLTPGASPSAGGSQVTGFNVAGARTQSNDYLIDGISNMDTQVNG
ncbi:MAG TPA: carboxypeptidase-like regulatory domain-containing protein, partial [Edaphobacter sp.]|nr:carboxypeptidase-like regulatory domain-containing protein [Edaphobacter sp.]